MLGAKCGSIMSRPLPLPLPPSTLHTSQMATVTDWAQSQRKGWLCELYGKDDTVTGARHLPTSSAQYRLVTILTDALSGTISSLESAKRTDSLVTTCIYVDAGMLFMNLLGLHFSAAETLNDEVILQCLADYMVELASLPDAINKGPIAQVIEAIDKGDSKEKRIEVGEVFELGDEGVLWRDLPGFGWNLTESFQGSCTTALIKRLVADVPRT